MTRNRKLTLQLLNQSIEKEKSPTVVLTDEQRASLFDLWFVYGNSGPKHDHVQHKWIQVLLEQGRE